MLSAIIVSCHSWFQIPDRCLRHPVRVLAGQDFRVMETSVAVNDYEILQKYCTRKQGGKFVSIILSYTTDTTAEADEILAAFTPLNTDTEAAPAE